MFTTYKNMTFKGAATAVGIITTKETSVTPQMVDLFWFSDNQTTQIKRIGIDENS